MDLRSAGTGLGYKDLFWQSVFRGSDGRSYVHPENLRRLSSYFSDATTTSRRPKGYGKATRIAKRGTGSSGSTIFTILEPAEDTTWIFLYQTIKQGK